MKTVLLPRPQVSHKPACSANKKLARVVVEPLTLKMRGCGFDPGLLQSFGCDFKPRPHLGMTSADDETLTLAQQQQPPPPPPHALLKDKY